MEATSFAKIVEQHVRKALKAEAVHGESKHGVVMRDKNVDIVTQVLHRFAFFL